MKFPLLLTSVLLNSVLVIYIIRNKTENETSKIPEISSWKEHTRLDNTEYIQTSRPGLKNGKLP